jgi:glycosyltransferase involved in cell wall biosynthesis
MFAGRKRYKILSVNPRKTHSLEQAAALAKIFGSDFLHLTSVYFGKRLINTMKLIAPKVASFMSKRSHPDLDSRYVHSLPGVEVQKMIWEKQGRKVNFSKINHDFQVAVVEKFKPSQACISYDGSSYYLFEQWKGKSKLILDLSIGVPQYRIKIDNGDKYEPRMIQEKGEPYVSNFKIYEKELALADVILCGSEFVKHSVEFVNPDYGKKCRILTYGAEIEEYGYKERVFNTGKNLKFIFSGGRVGYRKGCHTLIEAWGEFVKQFPECELHFFGTVESDIDTQNVPANVFFHGRVSKDEMIAQLKAMDVYIFPSTFEGGSRAVLEAMAMQFPIITTFNSVDVLEHGVSGEIIEANNKESLLNGMIRVASDADYRIRIGKEAYKQSAQYTWDNYRKNLQVILEKEGISA